MVIYAVLVDDVVAAFRTFLASWTDTQLEGVWMREVRASLLWSACSISVVPLQHGNNENNCDDI